MTKTISDSPLKIRLLLDANKTGGIETHVMNACRALIELQQDCRILFVRDYPDNPLYALCKTQHLPFSAAKTYAELIRLLQEDKPDIIHTHGYKATILSRLFKPFLPPCTLVTTYHAGEPVSGRLRLYKTLDYKSSFLSHNIAVNEAIARELPAQSTVIPNFVAMPKAIKPLKEQGPYAIYFVGRFSPEKNPLAFCQLANIPSSHFSWYAVGEGPLLDEAKALAQQQVHFLGPIVDMKTIWPQVDLLCITSNFEGLPMVLLEAMSYGIPVVAFDVGSIGQVIQNHQYLIQKGNLESMHNRIVAHFVQGATRRQEMAQQARKRVQDAYSSEVVVQRILQFYRECLRDDD